MEEIEAGGGEEKKGDSYISFLLCLFGQLEYLLYVCIVFSEKDKNAVQGLERKMTSSNLHHSGLWSTGHNG